MWSTQLRHVNDSPAAAAGFHVLFTLCFALKNSGPKWDGLVQAVAEAMGYVLENTHGGAGAGAQKGDLSEELKAAVLRYMDALLHAAYHDVVFKLFEPAMLPGLGAAISLLLALGEQEKSLTVQAAALKCLQALTLQCDCSLDHVSVGQ